MYDLILYDTSNFVDFPVGGQLTSISNFLKYIVSEQKKFCSHILLVGISTKNKQIGEIQKNGIDNMDFDFLPVLYRENTLTCVKKSLRLEYLKALIKRRKCIISGKNTIHYIHTPEAFIGVKLIYPRAKTVVFSHGSFFNMIAGFRFYQNNKLVHVLFNRFIVYMLKKVDLVFTLDMISTEQYMRYTNKVVQVNNSIVLPKEEYRRNVCHDPIRLLFVGRLSKVKQVDKIIEAMELFKDRAILEIVGDGEEYSNLEKLIMSKQLGNYVHLRGAVSPLDVGRYMDDSDILVMNSIFEGKPMTILEALSHGLPIITTPVGGIPEMTEKGKNAEYTNGKSIQIKEAVLKISNSYKTYEDFAYECSKKYDYKVVNSTIFAELSRLLDE